MALAAAVGLFARQGTAQDFGSELKKFVYDDAVSTLHVRSFYFDRTRPRPPNSAAWATGGWVGYESGWLYDAFRVGAVGYTTQPFWAPPDTGGTGILNREQYGFWVLGQAFATIRAKEQAFTAYRQIVDELEVNPDDGRMVPNTFEAYALRGNLGQVSYFAGYVAKMKPRESPMFVNMAERAGAPDDVTAGMWLGSLKYGSLKDLRLRASTYHVPDILTSGYGDVVVTLPVAEKVEVQLASNVMVQGSNGLNLITGKPFSTWSAGARADLLWRDALLWGAYTQTGSAAAYRTPYGAWLGFTKQLTLDFDRANERALQIGVAYNFAGIDLPGLTFRASGTFGNGAINPATGAALSSDNEYDLDLIYQVSGKTAPDWARPLQLRARAGYTDRTLNGVTTSLTEYRLILNYEIFLKKPR